MMATRFRFIVSCLLFSLQIAPLAAEHDAQIERFTGNEELPNLSISSIVQDHDDFLWFGTQGGLVRYDGARYLLYEHDPYDRSSLGHNLVQTMFLAPDGVLWVGTYHGLSRFDADSDSFTNYSHDPDDPTSLSNDVVVSIASDADGSIWVGTLGGLNHFDPESETFTRYYADDDDPASIANDAVRALLFDSTGTLWIGSYGGLDRYDREHDRFLQVAPVADDPDTLASPLVMSIAEAAPGELWIGCWGAGLSRYRIETGEFEHHKLSDDRVYALNAEDDRTVWVATWGGGLVGFDTETEEATTYRYRDSRKDSLSHDVVYSFAYDTAGILWIGTNGGGLCRIDERKDDFIVFRHDAEEKGSLSAGKVNAIYQDRFGDLWFGIYNGGLDRWDEETGRMVHHRPDPNDPGSLPNETVLALMEDDEDELWVASLGGLSRYDRDTNRFVTMAHSPDDPNSLADNLVYDVHQSPDGKFWIGTYNRGVDLYDPTTGIFTHYPHRPDDPNSLSDNLVYDIIEDQSGTVWIGTNMGLNRYDPAIDGFVRYLHDIDDLESLSGNTIRTLFEDSSGRLWIGTTGGGLNRYDPETNGFIHYTRREGLPSNTIMAILEDGRNRLWLATTAGITIFDPDHGVVISNIDESDGLIDTHFNAGKLRDTEGNLYFGTVSGVCRFTGLDAENNTHIPKIHITGIRILNEPVRFGRPIHEVERVEISYKDRYVAFEFAALDFAAPEQNQYAYRLAGFDKDWIHAGTRNFTSYTNLPPGRYTFEVRGSNNDGVWSETGASLEVRVTPPWARTWWAYLLYTVAGIGFLYLLMRYRSSFLLKQKIEELESTKAQLETANAQLVRTNQDLDDFAYIASHDLREPLRGISNYASFLIEDHGDTLSDDGQRMIDTVVKLSSRMNRLIGSLLDYSRIGRQELEIGSINPADVIAEVTESLGTLIAEKHAHITVASNLPRVKADEMLVYTIFYNLITNGIKYNDSDDIRISIRGALDATSGMAAFEVSDNGIGIPTERHDYVFKIFKRLHEREAYGGGSGAGLTIVQKAVERHGGTVSFESEVGEGTTFSFTLKAETDEAG